METFLPKADNRGAAGFSLLEVVVATSILLLIAVLLSDGFLFNLNARKKTEQRTKFLQVETALRSAAFRRLSEYMESGPNCAKPGQQLKALFRGAQPVKELRLRHLQSASVGRHPQAMAQRCRDQSTGGSKLENGIYLCFELLPESIDRKGFLQENEAYAEVFFGFWDVKAHEQTTCAAFDDEQTPARGARLYYSIYWRPKGPKAKKDGSYLSHSGIMYGQTRPKN
jgi:hypothetical protein